MLEIYLRKLKELEAETAHASLARPGGKKGFDYGKACGVYEGLLRAEQLLKSVMEEVENDEDK